MAGSSLGNARAMTPAGVQLHVLQAQSGQEVFRHDHVTALQLPECVVRACRLALLTVQYRLATLRALYSPGTSTLP